MQNSAIDPIIVAVPNFTRSCSTTCLQLQLVRSGSIAEFCRFFCLSNSNVLNSNECSVWHTYIHVIDCDLNFVHVFFNTSAKPTTFFAYHELLSKLWLFHTLLLNPGLNPPVHSDQTLSHTCTYQSKTRTNNTSSTALKTLSDRHSDPHLTYLSKHQRLTCHVSLSAS